MIWTLSDIVEKIRRDLNIYSDRLIRSEEIKSYIISAIESGEQIINMQGSDYFLTKKTYTTQVGDTYLDMPADVFNGWIRYLNFNENASDPKNGRHYKIKKIAFEDIPNVTETDDYRYLITNDASNGQRINIYPPIRESGSGHFEAFYTRKAKRPIADTDICDFPRMEYIFTYVKLQCLPKDVNQALFEFTISRFSKEEEMLSLMFQSLSADGEDHKIEPTNQDLEDYYQQLG